MPVTVTFDKVFTATGSKNGKEWKRWDFKSGDDRYSTFQKKLADQIEVGQPVTLEVEVSGGNNGYTNRTITEVLGSGQQQETGSTPEAVRTAPVASQGASGPSTRDTQIHRQTAAKVAAKLLDFFPKDEQSLETFFLVSDKLVDYFANGRD